MIPLARPAECFGSGCVSLAPSLCTSAGPLLTFRWSATKANVPGYYIGGKTGTAEKVVNGRYAKHKLLTDFMAVLPADKPKYLVLIMLDEPQGLKETYGFATAGWNAAPVAAKVITRIAPLLDLEPRFDLPKADQLILAKATETR